jgi:hypothetical protein
MVVSRINKVLQKVVGVRRHWFRLHNYNAIRSYFVVRNNELAGTGPFLPFLLFSFALGLCR